MAYFKSFDLKKQRKRNGTELSSLVPYTIMCGDGIVLLKNGAFSTAFEFTAPDIGSAAPSKIAGLASMFNTAVNRLGEGWAVQFELQRTKSTEYPVSNFDNVAGWIVEKDRMDNFALNQEYFENHYYLTVTYELPSEIKQRTKSIFFKKSESYDGLNLDSIHKELKYFNMECGKLANVLSGYMNLKHLDSDELFTYLHTGVSLKWHKCVLDESQMLILSEYITDTDLESSMPLKLGENYIPIISVNSFPGKTIPAMVDILNSAKCELRWSTRFICYSHELALKKIDKAEKKFHASRKSVGQYIMEMTAHVYSNREDSGAAAQESDAAQARVDITMGGNGFGNYTSNIMVWDRDYERAMEKSKYVSSLINTIGFTSKEETLNALQAFCSMMPGNVYANVRRLFVSTGNASHVVPLSSIWSGLKNNDFLSEISGVSKPHVICATDAGIPFFLNLNTRDVGHHWVSGPTGAGKSTYLALLEIQWLKYPNAQVIIFDKDLSARNVTVCAGGKYIEPGKDDVAFQPLAHLETEEEMRWASEFIECLLTEQKTVITATMRKAIYQTVRILSTKEVESRTLTSFCQYCDYINPNTQQNDIVDSLSPYLIDGQYGNLFDRVATDLQMGFWNMFEMGTLMNMSQGAVAPSLMYLFRECEKMFNGNPTLLILDEAWVFLKNETFARKIVEWLKVLRKKHVFVVFATQEIEDAAKSPVASTIISQCGSKVYLADDQATTPMMADAYRLFGLEQSEILLLNKSTKKHDYFFKSTLGTRQFQLDLDRIQLGVITNSEKDHKILNEIERKYGKNTGKPLVLEVLEAKKIDCRELFD